MTLFSRRALLSLSAGLFATGTVRAGSSKDLVVSGDGSARIGGAQFRCAIGRGGVRADKREGDGATPVGRWPLREVFYRADRLARPSTVLPARALEKNDGWCDAPDDAQYNRHVTHPYPASAEKLWRADHLYDLIVVVGYNDAPVVSGKGSAIFLHVARTNYTPTVGCVAFKPSDLLSILSTIDKGSHLVVRG
jgi:L,D-peptidoglycan transpeptidase YkuD (ErfK/YbiS/YcfS/YnhG family)